MGLSSEEVVARIAHSSFHQSRTIRAPKCPDCFCELVYMMAAWYCPTCGKAPNPAISGYEACRYCGS